MINNIHLYTILGGLEGEQPYYGFVNHGRTMVINRLLSGMILQVAFEFDGI